MTETTATATPARVLLDQGGWQTVREFTISNGIGYLAGRKAYTLTTDQGVTLTGPVTAILATEEPNADALEAETANEQEQLARNEGHFAWQHYARDREQYETLLANQSGLCAQCKSPVGQAPWIMGHVVDGDTDRARVLCVTRTGRLQCSPFGVRLGRP